MKKKLFRSALVLASTAILAYAAYYYSYGYKIDYYYSMIRGEIKNENIDPKKARDSINAILSWPSYGGHDAFLIAGGVGDETTVPLLIEALRHEGDLDPKEKYMDCSRAHLLASLRKLTGANAGVNASDWDKWKKETKLTSTSSQRH